MHIKFTDTSPVVKLREVTINHSLALIASFNVELVLKYQSTSKQVGFVLHKFLKYPYPRIWILVIYYGKSHEQISVLKTICPTFFPKEKVFFFILNTLGYPFVVLGFSFTNHSDGYNTRQEEIGSNLYKALVQFFQLFYEYQGSPFYLAGESYAGLIN